MPSFRLWTIFYVFALLATAMATFGPGGIFVALLVLVFWIAYWKSWLPTSSVINLLIVTAVIGMLVALLLPAVQSVRETSQAPRCMNNLKQLQLALLVYESVYGKLPPPYIADANGKPMHSWRVLILPYIEEDALYKKYNFNEPWDGPNNSKLAAHMPEVFRCPGESTDATIASVDTSYFAVVGPETAWPAEATRTVGRFKDGSSKTIMLVEASGQGVNWMEPRDLDLNQAVKLFTSSRLTGHSHVKDGFLATTYVQTSSRIVTFADGHCQAIGPVKDAELARALFTVSGDEKVPEEWNYVDDDVKYTTVIKWGKIWSLTLFVILSLLPALWLWRRNVRERSEERVEHVELLPLTAASTQLTD